VAAAMAAWKAEQPLLDPDRLVFIDETGASTNMVRRYGRCPKGERLIDKTPWGHWKTTTFVGVSSTRIERTCPSCASVNVRPVKNRRPRRRDRNPASPSRPNFLFHSSTMLIGAPTTRAISFHVNRSA